LGAAGDTARGPQELNTSSNSPRRGWRTLFVMLAIAGATMATGDSYVPLPDGLQTVRGGDIALAPPPPTWERRSIHAIIREAASAYGIDAALVRAVVWVESRYDPYAESPRGARGLMQLTSDTAREMGVTNAFDPRQNVFGGVKYLSRLIKQHDGDVALALASYNAGPEMVRRFGGVPPFSETAEYLVRIRRQFHRLPAAPAPPQEGPPAPALD
jgi:soluble lytic murein transglycosylase-like protein